MPCGPPLEPVWKWLPQLLGRVEGISISGKSGKKLLTVQGLSLTRAFPSSPRSGIRQHFSLILCHLPLPQEVKGTPLVSYTRTRNRGRGSTRAASFLHLGSFLSDLTAELLLPVRALVSVTAPRDQRAVQPQGRQQGVCGRPEGGQIPPH